MLAVRRLGVLDSADLDGSVCRVSGQSLLRLEHSPIDASEGDDARNHCYADAYDRPAINTFNTGYSVVERLDGRFDGAADRQAGRLVANDRSPPPAVPWKEGDAVLSCRLV